MSAIHLANEDAALRRPVAAMTSEPLITIRRAADAMGLKSRLPLRAVKNPHIPVRQQAPSGAAVRYRSGYHRQPKLSGKR
jgi:hypothetical protein